MFNFLLSIWLVLPFVTTVEHTVLFPHFELNDLLYRTVQLKEYVLFVTVVRQEMNFTICLIFQRKCQEKPYVDKYYTHHPNAPIFCSLMNMTSESKNIKLAIFISCILELFCLSQ